MFDESTIRQVVEAAERSGAPASIAMRLEADLREVLVSFRRSMERVNRHTEVLSVLSDCGFSVTRAADELGISKEAVYKHIRGDRKSTGMPIGVDSKVA